MKFPVQRKLSATALSQPQMTA